MLRDADRVDRLVGLVAHFGVIAIDEKIDVSVGGNSWLVESAMYSRSGGIRAAELSRRHGGVVMCHVLCLWDK